MKRLSILVVFAAASLTAAYGQTKFDVPMVTSDLSAPLTQMAASASDGPLSSTPYAPGKMGTQAGGALYDPAVQLNTVTNGLYTPGLSILGGGVGMPGFVITGTPPDSDGAVGKTQYMQWINSMYTIFDKTTGVRTLGPLNGNVLFTGFADTDCSTHNDGDPVVLYDGVADKWFVTQFAIFTASGHFKQCMAVSQTSDATGAWFRYSYDFGTNQFNDYGKSGVWPDVVNNGYFMGFNIFNAAGNAFLGPAMCAFDRANMILGATARGGQCFLLNPNTVEGQDFYIPSNLLGTAPPPPGSPNYFIGINSTSNSALRMYKFAVNWATPGSSSLTKVDIAVPAFTTAAAFCGNFGDNCVPQPGTAQKLDTLGDRIMWPFQYRNMGARGEVAVVSHTVAANGATAIRWYELRGLGTLPSVFQASTYAPDTTYRFMPSIALDKMGNFLLGYSASNATTVKPGVYVTGRTRNEPRNFMEAESALQVGLGVDTGPYSRWGDYSAMSVDPVDNCTFWYTNQYWPANGNSFAFATRIGSYKFANCQ